MNRWWIVLPDTEATTGLVERLGGARLDCVRHASGRPWLVGRWRGHGAVTAEAGAARVALLGRCRLSAEALRKRVGRVRSVGDLAAAVQGVAGSHHVVASVDGRVWARGTASAACRLFTTRVGHVPVGGPDADVLAQLAGSEPDMEMLAARLMDPPFPWVAVGGRTIWRHVDAVRPDEALVWERDGEQRSVRWWHPPRPEAPLAEAAGAVRTALMEAVATCTAGGGRISADLSGGLDSTSLCFLAATRGEAELVTVRWEGVDTRNDDAHWARRAVGALPGATHVVVGEDETPDWFAGVGGMRLATEEPVNWFRDVGKVSDTFLRARAHGSRLHLGGGGGDELFTPLPSHLADLVCAHPLLVLRRMRHKRLGLRVSRTEALRALLGRESYQRSLRQAGARLTAPQPPLARSLMGWHPDFRMPAWASPEAVDAARAALRDAAARCPEPLAPQRSMHGALLRVREGGNAVRQMNRVLPGPDYVLPYNDDAVVAAALSARPLEAAVPGRFKPLLTAAMDGIVPPRILRRTTKGCYDADFYRALRRQRGQILALLDGSLLGDAGLIAPDKVRRVLHSHATVPDLAPLMETLAGEIWLRSLDTPRRSPATALTRGTPGPESHCGPGDARAGR
ncbi:asparagine synthase-related protein [Streptomyces iconiensis]|uniref:Asparagine synthase-related protein n=1 Tax=Streptomyces iconiensis TaxID=1384038 RepID=A0ABT6ZUD1_9ACTN|nr:asparagine synthase-related protein [Streptomyces iconiensis]MDJ1132058.1 asparagine synthase-related protein [Streptomyces iconiensis]